MKAKPIYVEIAMKTSMEKLWEHTQSPELHQQWDLRFSEITYLPRDSEDKPQRFLYRTRIGFGLKITGTGETKAATSTGREGQRLSTLTFGSEQRISLIRTGGGYWKYRSDKEGDRVAFITQYDYRTRFGAVGMWADRLLFRPLFGYATAWSFDMLRIWLEKRVHPAITLERAFAHYLSVLLLGILWLYQGIVPKLLYPESGELALLRHTGWFPAWEEALLPVIGVAEIGFAWLLCLKHRKPWVYRVQALALLSLGIAAVSGTPGLLQAAFNPLTLSLAMVGLGMIAARTIDGLPNVSSCLRSPIQSTNANRVEEGGDRNDIDL